MIKLTNQDYPNFHVNIIDERLEVVVSLNVTQDMVPYLSPNNVWKTTKYTVYVLKTDGPILCMNEAKIMTLANILINRAMIHCREAKERVLEKQRAAIQVQSPRFTSSNNLL